MRHTEYGYVSPAENHCYRDLERWLADKSFRILVNQQGQEPDKKKRERRAKKHGAFSLEKKRRRGDM